MLVGEAPFTGPSVQAIVARVMTETPRSLTSQRKSIPQNVNAAVLKALDKLPADRFASAAEFSKALVTADYGATTQSSTAAVAEPSAPTSRIKSLIPWAIAGIATVAAIAFAYRSFSHQPAAPIHLAVDLPPNFKFVPTETETLGISADGSTITFVADVDGKAQMMMRRFDSDSLIAVKGSSNTQGSAEISPDGKWLAFGADRKMWKVPVAGGTPTPLTEAGWAQITWVGNDEIVYTKNYDTGLYRISSDGGEPKSLTTPTERKESSVSGGRSCFLTAITCCSRITQRRPTSPLSKSSRSRRASARLFSAAAGTGDTLRAIFCSRGTSPLWSFPSTRVR
jgi:Periplasmic component of the Tol biopolymer transport system